MVAAHKKSACPTKGASQGAGKKTSQQSILDRIDTQTSETVDEQSTE
jgi:hypothetical protein